MTGAQDGYAETPEGLLFIADGLSAPVRWDGIAAATSPVGVAAPAAAPSVAIDGAAADPGPARPLTACTLAKDGSAVPAGDPSVTTPIIGTYYAYVRYMNAAGVFSTLSPISNALTLADTDLAWGLVYTNVPVPPAGIIRRQILRNATGNNSTFYVDVDTSNVTATTFTSTNYDTTLKNKPLLLAASAAKTPGITGTYYAYVRFINDLGEPSNLSPVSAALILTDSDFCYGLTFTGVAVPTQSNVVRRQVLRNSSGQADVFYVDIDTTDLAATTFHTVKYDTALTAGTAVPIFDTDGNALANSHAQPPTHKRVMAHHLGRMFLAVDRNYSRGGCVTVSGSATVAGLNADWPAALAGRYLWVRGATQSYLIASVDVANQALTLSVPYADASNPYADYTIRPAQGERRLVYYSQAAEPESWPLTNAVSIQEDGDELTGLMVKGSFLYVLEDRHIYRYTFQSNPAKDGFVFLSALRGCVNNRCWVIAEGTAYMLDHSGVHAFDGSDSEAISEPVQHLFRSEVSGPRINWAASDLFFAAHSADEQYVRWFICLAGERQPRHALCLSYRDKRWWVEEFDRPVTAGCPATFEFRRRVFLGGEANRVYLGWAGTLEGVDPSSGTTRSLATSSSAASLEDAAAGAGWPASLVGQSVSIVSGRGAGQKRTVTAAAGGRLSLSRDWQVKPDATSVYQIGGVPWSYQSGWLRLAKDEVENARRVEVIFDPTGEPATMTMRVYRDFSATPVSWQTTRTGKENEGFATKRTSPDLLAEMAVPRGFAQARMDGHKELNMEGTRFVSVELSGVSGASEQTLFQVVIDGVQA